MEAASFGEDIADSAGRMGGSGQKKQSQKEVLVFPKGIKAAFSWAYLGDSEAQMGDSAGSLGGPQPLGERGIPGRAKLG